MELHPNARVLLSNAPALPEDGSGLLSMPTDLAESPSSEICESYNYSNDCSAYSLLHVCLRCKQHGDAANDCECSILRVSSGNVGSSISQSRNPNLKVGNTQEYGCKPVSSLVNPPHHSAQAAIKAEHPRRQRFPPWSSPKRLPMYWHVEWQTLRYRKYREKCRDKGSKDEKWPARVEEAFQMAIRIIRRQGRKKHDLHGKQSGGNEFIADYIEKTTGVKRNRKQVSSHIQVLKQFLVENQPWMSLVADIKPEKNSNKKAHGSTAHKEATGGHENSEYDGAFDYQPSQGPFPNRPSVPVDILASTVYRGPTIRRVSEFAMILEQKPRALRALCHTCTSIQSETASTPKALAEVNNWRERYPPLAAYYDQGQIECPIFFFDTRLSLMDHWPSDLTLTIPLTVDFSQGAHFTEWRSCSRFYKRNGGLVDSAEFHLDSESSDRLDFSQIKGIDDSTLVQIPFRSKWWVQVFSKMLERRIMMRRNNGDPELIREEEESDIQGLCIMQEIWATHRVYKHQQKMAILLWKFSTVRGGEVATTSWRRLIPPLPAYVIQSPHPPSEKPPMILDTTLQAASPYVAQPSIFSGYPTDDLLTAPLSGGNLPSPTPTPESRSFPSSTSTSFPSSVLNSTYPLYPSQESSFHSQDSAYRTLASFNSHDSGYPLYEHHESFEASHESYGSHEFVDGSQESYGSQEVISHSQDSLYQHAPDQLYEYPYPSVDPPITASACQDFTGGQIHLSYAQSEEDSHSSYEAPLIAPQANMMPQHQLIQHPEHFDQHDFLDDTPDDLVSGHHDQLDEQAHVQPLPQCYELNGLAIDYNAWEEALRMNPDLERHLGIEAVDEVGDIDQQYMGTVGHETLGSMPGEVLGEVQDRGADTPEEYQ